MRPHFLLLGCRVSEMHLHGCTAAVLEMQVRDTVENFSALTRLLSRSCSSLYLRPTKRTKLELSIYGFLRRSTRTIFFFPVKTKKPIYLLKSLKKNFSSRMYTTMCSHIPPKVLHQAGAARGSYHSFHLTAAHPWPAPPASS